MNYLRPIKRLFGFDEKEIHLELKLETIGNDCLKEIVKYFDGKDISNMRLLSWRFYKFWESEKYYIFQKITNIPIYSDKLTSRELRWYLNIISLHPSDNFLIGTNNSGMQLYRYHKKRSFNVYDNNLIVIQEKDMVVNEQNQKKQTGMIIFPLQEMKIAAKRGSSKLTRLMASPDESVFYVPSGIFCLHITNEKAMIGRNFNNGSKTWKKCLANNVDIFLDWFIFPICKVTEESITRSNIGDIISEFSCFGKCETSVKNRQLRISNLENSYDIYIDLEKNIPFKKEIYDFDILLHSEIILNKEEKIIIFQNEKLELIFMIKKIIITFYPFSKIN